MGPGCRQRQDQRNLGRNGALVGEVVEGHRDQLLQRLQLRLRQHGLDGGHEPLSGDGLVHLRIVDGLWHVVPRGRRKIGESSEIH